MFGCFNSSINDVVLNYRAAPNARNPTLSSLQRLNNVGVQTFEAQQRVVTDWLDAGHCIDDVIGVENGRQITFLDWAVRQNHCQFAQFLIAQNATVPSCNDWWQFVTAEMQSVLGIPPSVAAPIEIPFLSIGGEIANDEDVNGCANGIDRLARYLMVQPADRDECFAQMYQTSTISTELWYNGLLKALSKNLAPALHKMMGADLESTEKLGFSYCAIVNGIRWSDEQCYYLRECINRCTGDYVPGRFFPQTAYQRLSNYNIGSGVGSGTKFYETFRVLKASLQRDWRPPSFSADLRQDSRSSEM